MNTAATNQRSEWLKLHNSAQIDYEVTMRTLRTLPTHECIRYADQLYSDLHFADQMRRKAAQKMEG